MTLFLLFAALVVVPWTTRNACVLGGFTPVSTNSGINLLLGNSENAGSNTGVNVDISRYLEATKALSEKEKDVRLRQYAISWIRENPRAAINLYFFKLLNYFNFRNQLYVKTEGRHTRDIIMFLSYYPLLFLAALRLLMYKKRPISSSEAILYLIYFGNAFVSAIFFTRIRFRIPFDTLLIAIGAATLGLIVREITNRYISKKTNAGDAEALT